MVSASSRTSAMHLIGHGVDGDLEALADAHPGEMGLAEALEGPGDGLALWVEQFGLRHDLDDDSGHQELQGVRADDWHQSIAATPRGLF
jgi:hypothetical protein